jgi:hypothetical protein
MPGFSVFTRISGEDGLSSIFRKVGENARAAWKPVQSFNQAVAAPKTTALGRVGVAADNVASRFRAGLGAISGWLPALGALGSAASLAGLISMTRASAESFDGIAMSAEKLAVPVGWLSAMRYGARQTNVEAAALEKGLVKLKKATYDAATGKNKDAAALFKAMGVDLRKANGQVKGLEDSLEDIAERFARNADEEEKNAAALLLFGKAGADLIPFLNRGRDGIRQWREENARFRATTKEQAASLGDLDTAYKQLDKAGSGLSMRISAALAPALTRVVNWTTGWIVRNREFIGLYFDRKVAAIEKAFDGVAAAVRTVLDLPLVQEWTKGIDTGTAFDLALGGLGLTMAGPVFAAIGVVTKSIWAMNAAMWANPWVLLVGGIAAAAYAVYANWGPIKGWFAEQMAGVEQALDRGLVSGLAEAFERASPFNVIQETVRGLHRWLLGVDMSPAGLQIMRSLVTGLRMGLPDFTKVWGPIEYAMNWVNRQKGPEPPGGYSVGAGEFGMPHLGVPMPPPPTSSNAQSAAPQHGEVKVKVEFENTPPGTRVATDSKGIATIERSVGYSMKDNT